MHIVIEGQDATGKDTQAELLTDYLTKNYGTKQDIDHRTRVMLYLINRYEQWRKLAEPVLDSNGVVITTRNWFSTLVYEGYGAGVSRNLIKKLHKIIMPERYFHPDKIVILTLSDAERAKRLGVQVDKAGKSRKNEVWKSQADEFQKKVNHGYLKVAKEYDVPTLDAAGTIPEVQEKLQKLFAI